jgi:hypothetical protein
MASRCGCPNADKKSAPRAKSSAATSFRDGQGPIDDVEQTVKREHDEDIQKRGQ